MPYTSCAARTSPCASVPALQSQCRAVTVLPKSLPVSDFEVRARSLAAPEEAGRSPLPPTTSLARSAAQHAPAPGLCRDGRQLPLALHIPSARQAQYCVAWDSISWLNPMVAPGSEFVKGNATVCLRNGPIPPGQFIVQSEPRE